MQKYISIIAIMLIISGCSSKIKQKLGVVTTGPNEYVVEKQHPLEIPPHYDLPEPNSKNDLSDKS